MGNNSSSTHFPTKYEVFLTLSGALLVVGMGPLAIALAYGSLSGGTGDMLLVSEFLVSTGMVIMGLAMLAIGSKRPVEFAWADSVVRCRKRSGVEEYPLSDVYKAYIYNKGWGGCCLELAKERGTEQVRFHFGLWPRRARIEAFRTRIGEYVQLGDSW